MFIIIDICDGSGDVAGSVGSGSSGDDGGSGCVGSGDGLYSVC